jgi:hypothetical protein
MFVSFLSLTCDAESVSPEPILDARITLLWHVSYTIGCKTSVSAMFQPVTGNAVLDHRMNGITYFSSWSRRLGICYPLSFVLDFMARMFRLSNVIDTL